MKSVIGERTTYVRGIGQSVIGRRLGLSEVELTMQAAERAIGDAGLTASDIDGLATYPGMGQGTATTGFGGPGAIAIIDGLGLNTNWHGSGWEGPAQMAPIVSAAMAIATGLCRNVLVYRTVTESTAQRGDRRRGTEWDQGAGVDGPFQYHHPFGLTSAAAWHALLARYHFETFGLTREQLGWLAVTTRDHASRNPNAILREPMGLDEYMAARMIVDPLCLFDCDIPCDGSTAFVISNVESASDCPHVPIQLHAVGTAVRGRLSWDQWEDLGTFPGRGAAEHLWGRADVGPGDVDFAQIYDGFSMIAVLWLEALGFCGIGEAGPFIEGGSRIGLNGELPLNTGGGQLSGGRLHGFGLIHEAVSQLRGNAGERQVAQQPEVGVVANGSGFTTGCAILTRGLS